jgi:hypothetical protein
MNTRPNAPRQLDLFECRAYSDADPHNLEEGDHPEIAQISAGVSVPKPVLTIDERIELKREQARREGTPLISLLTNEEWRYQLAVERGEKPREQSLWKHNPSQLERIRKSA